MDTQTMKRRRPALSCIECRRRKIRCDRQQPCKSCLSASIQCGYKTYGRSPGQFAVNAAPKDHATFDSECSSTNRDAVAQNAVLTESALQTAREVPDELATTARQAIRHRLPIVQPSSTDFLPAQHVESLDGWQILKSQVGVDEQDVALNKTRVPRWSEWMGTGPEFMVIHSCYMSALDDDNAFTGQESTTAAMKREVSTLMQESKSLARSVKANWTDGFQTLPISEIVLPPRHVADEMATLYFECFGATHRTLHRPTFWSDYGGFWLDPARASMRTRLTTMLVITLGASVHESLESDDTLLIMCHQCIFAAFQWLGEPSEKARLNVQSVQISCLAFLARQVFAAGCDSVWSSLGKIISIAMQINLHRDPKYLPGTSVLDGEVRRRLWATILELELQTALDMALPPRLTVDDYDVEAPANIDDHELRDSGEVCLTQPIGGRTEASLQIFLLETVPIRFQILKLINGLRQKWSYDRVLELHYELITSLTRHRSLLQTSREHGVTAFQRNLMELLVRRFLLPLHCPFVSAANTNVAYQFSRTASVHAATAILSVEPDAAFHRLIILGGSFLREGLRCAFTANNVALMMDTDQQYREGSVDRMSHTLEPQKRILRQGISLAAEQIQRYETNISLHMTLTMVLARNNAVGLGQPVEPAMMLAARDSLQLCCGLLRGTTQKARAAASHAEDTGQTSRTILFANMDFDWDVDYDWNLDWNLGLGQGDVV